MRYKYSVQGTLFRNLGDGASITAGNVTLRQGGELGRQGFCEGWSFAAGLVLEASGDAEASKSGSEKVQAFLDSVCLVGRDDLENEPFLDDSGAIDLTAEGQPGTLTLEMRLLYGANAIDPGLLQTLESQVQQVMSALSISTSKICLASHWYRIGLGDPNLTDRFMKFWVAFDVLVPLGKPPREFDHFKDRAVAYLGSMYPGQSTSSLFDNLYQKRKNVFHEGNQAALSSFDVEKTRFLVRNLIFLELGLTQLGQLPSSFF